MLCDFCLTCRAETESRAYRKMAAEKGICLDETDEQWTGDGKENQEKVL